MREFLFTLVGLALTGSSFAQDGPVQDILEKYNRLRPNAKQLAMYNLDWEETLEAAQARAKLEGRPIFLVIIHARYGDLHSGHC